MNRQKGNVVDSKTGSAYFRDYYMEEGDKWNIQFPSMAVCEFDFCGLKHPLGTEKGDRVRDIIVWRSTPART